MVVITLPKIKTNVALELINELKAAGLIISQDFEWAYYPERVIHDLHSHEIIPRYCEFRFRDPKLATFYALKWQCHIGQTN